MVKKVFKVIFCVLWYLIAISAIILAIYFLVNGGATDLGDLSAQNGGFWGGIKAFFVNLWEGIKSIFVK